MMKSSKSLSLIALCCATLFASGVHAQELPQEWVGAIREAPRPRDRMPATAMQYADIRRAASDPDVRDYRASDYAMLSAARRGDWAAVSRLLKAGAQPNVRDVLGDSVLARAASAGELNLVRALIAAGADVNRRGASGFTPLGGATLAGHHAVVALLLRAGADVDVKSANGHVPLIDAVLMDRGEVIAELLRHRPDFLQYDRELGRHALSLAAYLGHIGVMDQLLAAGFDPNEIDRSGFNALYWAVFRRQRLAVAHLLASGAEPGAMSTDIYD
ncbi:ankyrin repeat domain-containing protein [Methyloversatilis thermotolerans]|uniref:ankyrin repeat domain-containing protein n=1 Tax=Methyloversatilis thermotolerans TaxID=1346290 RepID=UPI0003A97776|nr:ankyrin repeat domain-containing protein [Methyloversatilis thermotolerans]